MGPTFLNRAASFLLTAALLWPLPLRSQEEVLPLLRGEVRVGNELMPEGVVVLHRVSAEASGEIDSVRVESDGTFAIPLPHVPDHTNRSEIFFASIEYRGLLYFGPAVTEAIQMDSLYLIQAYDTLSVAPGGVEVPLSVRNLVLEKAQSGWAATDVFLLRNDGDRTLFSPSEGVVWSYPLPSSAAEFQVGQGDMAPEAVRFTDGSLEVYSPLPPGERYLVVGYRIPEDNFDLPLPGRTDRIEVLVREPAPATEFAPLSPSTPVDMEGGAMYRRYAADSLVNAQVRAQMTPEPWSFPAEWIGLLMAGLLGAAGIFGYRRRSHPSPAGSSSPRGLSREELLLRIAQLDEEFQATGASQKGTVAKYERERRDLLARLKRLS